MKYSREYIQNCNLLLVSFMIIFGILGLITMQKSSSEKELQVLDKQLDQYEVELTDYQNELESMNASTSSYQEKYKEYETKYDEYMKVFTQRQELYKRYEKEEKSGVHFNGSILFFGIVLLIIIMVAINIYFKFAK